MKKPVGFRLSDLAIELLKKAASDQGVSQTATMEMLIRERLDSQEARATGLLKKSDAGEDAGRASVVERLTRDRLDVFKRAEVCDEMMGRVKHIKLSVFSLVGRAEWINQEDGDKVYKKIVEIFLAGYGVSLSLLGRELMTHTFVNAAIGQLYNGDYSDEFLTTHIEVVNAAHSDREAIYRVVKNAKTYFSNQLSV